MALAIYYALAGYLSHKVGLHAFVPFFIIATVISFWFWVSTQ